MTSILPVSRPEGFLRTCKNKTRDVLSVPLQFVLMMEGSLLPPTVRASPLLYVTLQRIHHARPPCILLCISLTPYKWSGEVFSPLTSSHISAALTNVAHKSDDIFQYAVWFGQAFTQATCCHSSCRELRRPWVKRSRVSISDETPVPFILMHSQWHKRQRWS